MIIRLQHHRSDGENDIYHLKSGRRYHLGRGSACEVRILDLKLSRKHCAVEYSEGEWRVVDLASTNGCKVDGDQIVGSQPLKVGTQIEIGQSTLQVLRILGDDEAEDEDDAARPTGAATPLPPGTPPPGPGLRTPPPAGGIRTPPPPPPPQLRTPPPKSVTASSPSLAAVEQEPLGDEGPKSLEHPASDWDPEPEPEAHVKTGALEPVGGKPDPLAAARKAAQRVADESHGGTGEIMRTPPQPRVPAPPAPPRVEPQPPMPPIPAVEFESGPFAIESPKSLEPMRPAQRPPPPPPPVELRTPAPANPAPAEVAAARQPGTETRKRQKVQPVILQAISEDEAPARPPAPPAAVVSAPAPAAPAPVPAPAPAAKSPASSSEADRTFFITVLGRRVGPLTRAAARDLKARELKGTLTLKDLESFS